MLGSRLYYEFTAATLGSRVEWQRVADGVAQEVRRHGGPAAVQGASATTHLEAAKQTLPAAAQAEGGSAAYVLPSRIPSLCTRSTRAGIEWCCCHRAVCMARPR